MAPANALPSSSTGYPPSITIPTALGTVGRGVSSTGLPPKQQEFFQVWQLSREHKNPSNDCKSAAGVFYPPAPRASQPRHAASLIRSQRAPAVPADSQDHGGSAGMCIAAPSLQGRFWFFVYLQPHKTTKLLNGSGGPCLAQTARCGQPPATTGLAATLPRAAHCRGVSPRRCSGCESVARAGAWLRITAIAWSAAACRSQEAAANPCCHGEHRHNAATAKAALILGLGSTWRRGLCLGCKGSAGIQTPPSLADLFLKGIKK